MVKQLLKKQIAEMFQSFFINKKQNKKRSAFSTFLFIVFYVLLIVGILGGMFAYLSLTLCKPLISEGLDWLYFAFLGMIALALGIFGGVFNTYSGLYLAKDNDLLLSMPIPTRYILLSRLLSVYLMGVLYSSLVMIPAIVVYLSVAQLTTASVIGGLLLLLSVTIIVMILSCILGWVVAKISTKLKNKSFITVVVTLAFLGGYYFIYFKANTLINNVIANAQIYSEKIKASAYPIYIFGSVGTGDVLSSIIVLAILIALSALTYYVISKSFLKLATTSSNIQKKKYVEKKSRVNSIGNALIGKEMKKFFSTPSYILNCGMGLILLPIVGIVFLIKGNSFMLIMGNMFGSYYSTDTAAVIIAGIICLLASMNNMSAPSISLEGKSIWISQSLPVTPWQVIKSKFDFHFILTAVPAVFCSVCAIIMLNANPLTNIFVLLFPVSFAILFDLLGLTLNLKSPNLTWTNEVIPIKQGMSVFVSVFGGWIYSAVSIVVFIALMGIIPGNIYLIVSTAATLLLSLVLCSWLKKKGAKIYSEL